MNAAISAAAMRCKTLVDGTLQITVNVEPCDAQAAFALFGKPSAPMALAALVVGHAAVGAAPAPEPAPNADHALSKWAALRCQDREFRAWITRQSGWGLTEGSSVSEEIAAERLRAVCGVKSRAEFDTDPAAAARLRERVLGPWQKYALARGIK